MTERTSENVQYFHGATWDPKSEAHFAPGPGIQAHDGGQVPGPPSHMTWITPNGVSMATPASWTLGPDDDWDPEGKAFMIVKSLEDGRKCTRITGHQTDDLEKRKEVWTVCQKYEAWREIR